MKVAIDFDEKGLVLPHGRRQERQHRHHTPESHCMDQQTKVELAGVLTAAGIAIGTPTLSETGASCDMAALDKVMRVNVRGSVDLAC